jgi:hypothetical protein
MTGNSYFFPSNKEPLKDFTRKILQLDFISCKVNVSNNGNDKKEQGKGLVRGEIWEVILIIQMRIWTVYSQ